MCLAIPGKIISIDDPHTGPVRTGKVNFSGIVKSVCLEYVPESKVGDYVLVHVGFALSRIDEEEAERTFRLLEEMGELMDLQVPREQDGEGL